MTEHSLETSAVEQLQTTSVADYIVQRIADEGVAHCFGVAGDYLFPMCNAVEHSPKLKWISCANELNAAYAADGYSRIRGAGMVATTYGVGELSALNGVMGAKAERSLVFHVVGMPSYQNQRLSKIAHHTLGDGNFGNFAGLSAAAACCSAIINPDNCVIEMERPQDGLLGTDSGRPSSSFSDERSSSGRSGEPAPRCAPCRSSDRQNAQALQFSGAGPDARRRRVLPRAPRDPSRRSCNRYRRSRRLLRKATRIGRSEESVGGVHNRSPGSSPSARQAM